ncbi:sensor histidine kinase [Psychroserpens luteolus]|uniref:sensor histidine kinase n=1 Tax=Psychroserpens luteolus TaxID=2855840 RepID=UPI001E542836|nr:histidine kinase [Psychroserpens luteolus]MCD2258430.1 histidine kinase [Psychroserpens luteolus]
MRLSKELKYNIIFGFLLILIGQTWEYSNDLIFNQGRTSWFKPGAVILFFTYNIAYFSVYLLNYLVFAPRFLKPNKIVQYLFSFVIMTLCFAIVRFFLEEILILELFNFHNYNLNRPNIVAIYLTDSALYASRPCLFSSLMFLFFRFTENKSRIHQLELQHQEAQMAMLKSQISPHFLFNTLNGFYSELYDKQPETANDILKLSKLLRYVTYDAKDNYMPLSKEISFIEDYLYFFKRRYEDEFFVDLSIEGKVSNQKVPSLMLIHFIENLCKHGIINDSKQRATIKINVSDEYLEIQTKNEVNPSENYMDKGIGSNNIKKRLKLLFDNNYILNTKHKNNTYLAYLKIPI